MKSSKPSLNWCSPWSNYPNTQKNQTMTFGPFFHFFGHFTTLRGRISGKHGPKVKIFAKFEFSVSDLPKKSKILPKKLFWPIFIFFNCDFWQYDIWFSDHSSEIPHRTGSSGVSFDRAHVGAHQSHLRQIAHVPVKYNLFSKFKIVIFWRFFDLDPTWTLDLWLSNYVSWKRPRIHIYWQNFSSVALRLPVQKLLWQS